MSTSEQRFQRLTHLLKFHAVLWRGFPFQALDCPWQAQAPALYNHVMQLTTAEVEALQADETALRRQLGRFLPEGGLLETETTLAPLPTEVDIQFAPWQSNHIPGRKLEQIRAFARAIGRPSGTLLDWCCGKGHLGRTMARLFSQAGRGIEIDPVLVEAGNRLSQQQEAPLTLAQCDVLGDTVERYFSSDVHAVALHACGGLHRHLVTLASAHSVARLSLAPCCYHLYGGNDYQPLSRQGRHSGLALTHEELRHAVRQTITAPARVHRQRQKMQSWRLGFDSLQRDLTGNAYLPVPSLPVALLKIGFENFCREVAQLKGIHLPPGIRYRRYETLGEHRFDRFTRLSLVQMLFRRPLELWLVLDLVLMLGENGYACRLGTFCPEGITPRNLMLDARR